MRLTRRIDLRIAHDKRPLYYLDGCREPRAPPQGRELDPLGQLSRQQQPVLRLIFFNRFSFILLLSSLARPPALFWCFLFPLSFFFQQQPVLRSFRWHLISLYSIFFIPPANSWRVRPLPSPCSAARPYAHALPLQALSPEEEEGRERAPARRGSPPRRRTRAARARACHVQRKREHFGRMQANGGR